MSIHDDKSPVMVIGRASCTFAHSASHCWSFFFFQAEDGIRDLIVTGVQTCALPICVYFIQSLNLMWDHLQNGKPLPPSQLVRTKPRELKDGKPVAITRANVPPIEQTQIGRASCRERV